MAEPTTNNSSTTTKSTFTLLLFASAGTYAGQDSITLPAPMPLSRLFSTLESKFTGITAKVLESSAVTVNLDYVDMPTGGAEGENQGLVIKQGDEVAIIPPVSSG